MKPKSFDRRQIEKLLTATKQGEIITYEHVAEVTGEDCGVRSRIRDLLQTIVSELWTEGVQFECHENVGYYRLKNSEVSVSTQSYFLQKGRLMRRKLTGLMLVDVENMNKTERERHFGTVRFCAAVSTKTTKEELESSIKKEEQKTIEQQHAYMSSIANLFFKQRKALTQ